MVRPGSLEDVLEVRRFTGEAVAVLRVVLVFPAPEIGRIGDIGIGGVDDCQAFSAGPMTKAAPPAAAVYSKRITRLSLGGIEPTAQWHTRAIPEPTSPIAMTMASVPALQANSISAAWTCGCGTDGFGDDGGGGFDSVGMGFRTNPHGANLGRVDIRRAAWRCGQLRATW